MHIKEGQRNRVQTSEKIGAWESSMPQGVSSMEYLVGKKVLKIEARKLESTNCRHRQQYVWIF